MTKYNLIVDFGIDNNELSGVSREMAFVLGAEFTQVRMLVQKSELPIEIDIHKLNVDRFINMLTASGLVVETEWINSRSTEWSKLVVKEPPPDGEVIPFRDGIKK